MVIVQFGFYPDEKYEVLHEFELKSTMMKGTTDQGFSISGEVEGLFKTLLSLVQRPLRFKKGSGLCHQPVPILAF